MTIIMFSVSFQTPSIRRSNERNNIISTANLTTTIPSIRTEKSTYQVGESSRTRKRSNRQALRSQTPVRFNLNVDGGDVRKEYDKYIGVSEGTSFNSYTNASCIKIIINYTLTVINNLIKFAEYFDHGDPTFECTECHALVWEAEARKGNLNPTNKSYSICCGKGKVFIKQPPPAPQQLHDLFYNDDAKSKNFKKNVRTYNSMFSFTSMGGKVDEKINNQGRAPYVFRLHGQTYHSIGSLIPEQGAPPKFAQLYIYDTDNETENRAKALR